MHQPTVNDANQALMLLLMFLAFSMIIGGSRGRRWAINLMLQPVRTILGLLEKKISAIVTVLVLTVLAGYGFLRIVHQLLK